MQGALIKTSKMWGDANETLKIQEVPIKTLKMPTKPWRCEKNDVNTLKTLEYATKTLKMSEHATKNSTLHKHAHRSKVKQHRLQIHDLLSFWRKLTSSRFQRHDVRRYHSEGRWCGSNFRAVKWHTLEKRQCNLDLQGTRRYPQEIGDTKHTSKTWEDVYRRWAMPCKLHSLQKRLKILFYSTTKNQLMFIIISRKAE